MKFWQPIVWAETEQLCEIARFAEECGFEGLMGADHALFPETMAPDYPYSDNGLPPQTAEHEYPDMWTSAAAMLASVNSEIATITMPIDPITENATSRSRCFAANTPTMPITSETRAAGSIHVSCRPCVTSSPGWKIIV